MRSTKTKKIETAARANRSNDEATSRRLMQAMTAFMAASAADQTGAAQQAA
ncbi:MAG TPA: hypothetical protein VGL83_03120 [Stellaceae bacterium]|jgi:hypothetical protein